MDSFQELTRRSGYNLPEKSRNGCISEILPKQDQQDYVNENACTIGFFWSYNCSFCKIVWKFDSCSVGCNTGAPFDNIACTECNVCDPKQCMKKKQNKEVNQNKLITTLCVTCDMNFSHLDQDYWWFETKYFFFCTLTDSTNHE